MQSTGQGAIHKSQPVHHSVNTVCICLDAPTMASTGHACMQSVQPIHALGSMKATGLGLSTPQSGSIWAV